MTLISHGAAVVHPSCFRVRNKVFDGAQSTDGFAMAIRSHNAACCVERRRFLRELGWVAEVGLLKTWFWSVPRSFQKGVLA